MNVPFVPLKDVVVTKTGSRNPSATPDMEFDYVDVASVDNAEKRITGARRMVGQDAPSRARKLIRTGDVLLATIRPNLNAVALVPPSLDGEVASTGFCVLRARDAVLPEYLFYFCRSASFVGELCKLVAGAMYPAVTDSQVLDQRLPMRELGEQRRIVDLLTRAEGIVRLRREAAAKAAELIPALFIHHFGDPATNPMGWPVVELGALLDEPPTLGTMKKPTAEPQPWLDLRVANIQGGRLRLEDQKWLHLTDDEVARFSLRSGDIVLARAIGSLDHLGKAVVVEPSGQWAFDSHLMRVRLDQRRLLPRVLKTYLETAAGRREFLSHTRRSAVQFNINGKELRRLTLPLPPMARQCDFLRQAEASVSIETGVDPLRWTGTGLILKPFRVLSGHARRHLRQHQTGLACSFQSSEVRGSPGHCDGAWGCTSLQSI